MSDKIERELESYKLLINCIKTRCKSFINYPEHLKARKSSDAYHDCGKYILELVNSIEEEIKIVKNSKLHK